MTKDVRIAFQMILHLVHNVYLAIIGQIIYVSLVILPALHAESKIPLLVYLVTAMAFIIQHLKLVITAASQATA